MNESSYLTTRDVAERMDVSLSTVRRLIRRGELQASRVKGAYHIKLAEFERFTFKRWCQQKNVRWF